MLDHTDAIDCLEVELARTVALAGRTPSDLAIDTCPGWAAADLWEHLGAVHRWTAEMVTDRSTERISRRDIDLQLHSDGDWSAWLSDGADILLGALRGIPAEEPMWVWGTDPHARWWSRRQLHETYVHNVDAALALGESLPVRPDLAADGVDELLDNLPARLSWPGAAAPTELHTVHLHSTDEPTDSIAALEAAGEWMITLGGGQIGYDHGHGKGDVALRGPVASLLLVIYGRLAPDHASVERLGDPGALDALLAATAHG